MNPFENFNNISKFVTRILGSIQEDEANDVGVDSAVPQFTLTLSCYVNTKVPVEKQGCLDVVSDNVTHLVVCASHQAILDKVCTVAAWEAASCPTGRAGATATGSERDITCPPISQWAALEDKTLNIEQPIVINGVEYPFFYDARALMRGVNPIVPLVLCHRDQCAEFLFLLSKVNKFVNNKLGERLNLYIII